MTWLRGARCTEPKATARRCRTAGAEGDGSGPEAQNRHGGAPRGERPASWDARRLARRLACRVMCTPNGCRCTRTSLGAPPTPRFGVGEAKSQTPDAKMRHGNEMGCLKSWDGTRAKVQRRAALLHACASSSFETHRSAADSC